MTEPAVSLDPGRAWFVAVDLGAESGRVTLGALDEVGATLIEVARFTNLPLEHPTGPVWDMERLWGEIRVGLAGAAQLGVPIRSVAVDTWGVDFGLLDGGGQLLAPPSHYRHPRTRGWVERVSARLAAGELFCRTGNAPLEINTLFQLAALHAEQPQLLERARTLLLMPGLFGHLLSGNEQNEFTVATTTQCFDPCRQVWDRELLGELGIPAHFLRDVVAPATLGGELRDAVVRETGLLGTLLAHTASHDTAAAVSAIVGADDDQAFLSSGTWSLMGLVTARPAVGALPLRHQLTNEGGTEGENRVLRNITGMHLLRKCREAFAAQGYDYDYGELVALAEAAPPGAGIFDPNHASLSLPSDMPEAIRKLVHDDGKRELTDHGALVRAIFESLAVEYRRTLDALTEVSGHRPSVLRVVGGGSKNALLCQLTADMCQIPVHAGPAETTLLGNLLGQAVAVQSLPSYAAGRRLLREHFRPVEYLPRRSPLADELVARRQR